MAELPQGFIPATEAIARLGLRPASLYSYASRGLIRTAPHPIDSRQRLYSLADIEALSRRKARQRKPATAAATALDWGLPVLETRLSRIEGGRLFFRDKDAVALSETATLEDVAALLWDMPGASFAGGDIRLPPVGATRATDRAMAALAALLPDDRPGESGARLQSRAGKLVRAVASGALAVRLSSGPLHQALAEACAAPAAADFIRRALVLAADHELNASSFAARVAASTGASLTNCLCAGLAALSGPAHGGVTERLSAFCDEAARAASPAAAVAARLDRGETIPGFGHPLYPDGDPRAAALLAHFAAPPPLLGIAESVEAATGLRPTIDFALVAIEKAFTLPVGAALALFATGRSVGWIAHALEQRATGQLIRPRARYVG
jgi:citrate synthase